MNNAHRYDHFGFGPGKNAVHEEEVSFPLQELWRSEGLLLRSELFVDDTNVIVVTSGLSKNSVTDSKILAINRKDGTLNWEFPLSAESGFFGGGTCLYGDMVVAQLTDAVSPIFGIQNGKEIWRSDQFILARVIGQFDGEIMLAAKDGICFVNPDDGTLIRRYSMNCADSPTFNEDVVIAWSYVDRMLNCFDRRSGKLLWCTDFAEVEKVRKIFLDSVACRSPIIVGDRLYTAIGTRIACFDLKNGDLLWKNDAEYLNAVLYRNGRLHGTQTNGYYCLDAATGEVIHKITCSDAIYGDSLPYMAGKYLFCTGKRLVAIDTDTGEEVWVKEDKRKTHYFMGQPIFLDGCLYTADNKGNLYCFAATS